MELRCTERSCGGQIANVINIVLDRPVEPSELSNLKVPEIDHTKGIVITGRAPIWLYAALVHEYHPTPWIGIFDPRLGVVVAESHIPPLQRGDVLQWDYDTPEQMPTS